MKQQGIFRKIWGVVYPVLYYLAAQIIVTIIMEFAAVIFIEIQFAFKGYSISTQEVADLCEQSINEYMMWLLILSIAITLPWMLYVFNKDNKRESQMPGFIKYEKVSALQYIWIVPLAIVSMYAGSCLASILQMVMPSWFSAGIDEVETALYSGSMISQVLAIFILGPILEEIIFRGLVYNRIRRMSNKAVAWIASALIFGAFHLNFVQGVYAFVVGILLVFVYERYKNIAAPILFHMSANGFSLLLSSIDSDTSDAATELVSSMKIYYLISTIGFCIVASIFTVGFVMLICQKVNPNPVSAKEE